jgi:hypothetical protein
MINWNEWFVYGNGVLYWKKKPSKRVLVGDVAGTVSCDYKIVTGYFGLKTRKSFKQHRIIWEMYFGVIPKGYAIDHVDRNPLNNKIENLRLVTHKQNMTNLKDTAGVYLHESGWYHVCIKRVYYGSFKTREQAEEKAKQVRSQLKQTQNLL